MTGRRHIPSYDGIPLVLAPMAGFTDASFRMLCKSFGCDRTVTEMVSGKGLHYGSDKTSSLLSPAPGEGPIVMQLFGREPDILAEAARYIEDTYGDDVLGIDLNFGCPAPKITTNGEGSALLREPVLCGRIVRAVAEAVKVPVSVKLRKGFGEAANAAPEIARIAEENGARLIAVHGRTCEQRYAGLSDWSVITAVRDTVRVPVIGNGDIRTAGDALRMLAVTGCDGLMIGRGALGNPWLFRDIRLALESGDAASLPPVTREERSEVILRHARAVIDAKGPHGIVELRKHLPFYIPGGYGSAKLRARLATVSSLDEIGEILLDTQERT